MYLHVCIYIYTYVHIYACILPNCSYLNFKSQKHFIAENSYLSQKNNEAPN